MPTFRQALQYGMRLSMHHCQGRKLEVQIITPTAKPQVMLDMLPINTCNTAVTSRSHAEAHVVHKPAMHPVAVSHPQCDSTASLRRAGYGSSARCPLGTTPCSRSQESSRVYADMPKSELADEPAEIAASTPAGDSKNDATILQAQKLSSWCHVKHSRGETPELSRDQVKALVQVHAYGRHVAAVKATASSTHA